MRAQPKKTKKGEISTACPSSGECYKAVIMPENEKWNKVVGARKGEAETETKSWKFRAQRVKKRKRKVVFITYAKTPKLQDRHTIKTGINNSICISLCFQVCESVKVRKYVEGGEEGRNAEIYRE